MTLGMKTRRKALGIVFGLLVCIVVAIGLLARPSERVKVTVSVVGVTNWYGKPHIVLTVTNHSDIKVSRSTKIWWVEDIATGQRVHSFDAIDFLAGYSPIPRPAYATIGPRQSRNTLLPFPTNQAPWRAVLLYGPVNWKLRLAKLRAGDFRGNDFVFDYLPHINIDRSEFYSDSISTSQMIIETNPIVAQPFASHEPPPRVSDSEALE